MFNPEYRITEYFVSCCEKIASQVTLIKESRIGLPLQHQLEREFISRSVHSSTRIEGNRLSLDQVVAIAAQKHIAAEEDQKGEVNNCIKALQWTIKNKEKTLTEKRLLKIHQLMTASLLSSHSVGAYRKVQNYIVNAKGQVIFSPPKSSEVPHRMNDLLKWGAKKKNVHPFVKSAILHHELVTIHPFVDGNGRVARMAAQKMLLESGYEPFLMLGIDDFFCRDRGRYYQMIQQARELDYDYTYWIDYVAEGLLYGVNQVLLRLKKVKGDKKTAEISLTPKQEELLALLSKKGVMGSADIGKVMKINRARVNQLIAPLVKVGIVIKDGITRAVRYRL